MKDQVLKTLNSVIIPTVAACTFLAGAIVFVANVVHYSIPRIIREGFGGQLKAESIWTDFLNSSSPWFLSVALMAGLWTVFTLQPKPTEATDPKMNAEMFSSHLIGLGYFLLVDAILTVVALACLAATGQLDDVLKHGANLVTAATGASSNSPTVAADAVELRRGFVTQAVILGLSLAMAILGALFYFANSLWTKFAAKTEMFNQNVFWAGLWFRLAEAVVFTLAFFLALRFYSTADSLYLMPMIGLFVGMTVKSAEALVFGLAERTLAAATALVSPPEKKAPPPKNTAAAAAAPDANGNPPSGAGASVQIPQRGDLPPVAKDAPSTPPRS